jgi:hypothetical protein
MGIWMGCSLLSGNFFLLAHFLILLFWQKAFYPIHDHRMIASAATATSGAYAVPRETMIACLAGTYAV